jgi:hypothetical protein
MPTQKKSLKNFSVTYEYDERCSQDEEIGETHIELYTKPLIFSTHGFV